MASTPVVQRRRLVDEVLTAGHAVLIEAGGGFGKSVLVEQIRSAARAMIALGVPVLTSDYELWVHIDDVELLNQRADSLVPCPLPDCRRSTSLRPSASRRVDALAATLSQTSNSPFSSSSRTRQRKLFAATPSTMRWS